MTRRPVPTIALLRRVCLMVGAVLALLWPLQVVFDRGHEGHVVVALIAEHYMTGEAFAGRGLVPRRAGDL